MSSERTTSLRESETVELKKSLSELKQGLISMVAILNKHGAGDLWFGVAPDGRVVGLEANEKTMRDVSQSIGAHVEPRIYPLIEQVTLDNKHCLHLIFEGRETPYFAYGRAYMRVADEDRQLTARELENLILRKNRNAMRWDNQPCDPDTLSLDSLDASKIRRFVQKAGFPWDNPENALDKLELRKKGQLLNAAGLFFKQTPLQLRCAVFASTDSATIIDRHDFDGDILELIEEAQKYILKNIHIGMRLDGLYRVDVPEISMEALREVIINAFCHRDYRDPDYIQIAIFKNRVEIRSPGDLYDGLTLEEMRRGNISRRRNPLIADLFRRINMVEGWGRGMPLILENAPDVQFRQIAGLFIAGFDRPSFHEDLAGETVDKTVDKADTMENHMETTQNHAKPLETTQSLPSKSKGILLNLLLTKPDLSQKKLAELSGLTLYSVRHHMESLEASGHIRHIGPTRGGHWEILDGGMVDPGDAGRDGV